LVAGEERGTGGATLLMLSASIKFTMGKNLTKKTNRVHVKSGRLVGRNLMYRRVFGEFLEHSSKVGLCGDFTARQE